jgi:hypothetical protein
MDVCDLGGEKVGTIAHLYRAADAAVGAGAPAGTGEPPFSDGVIEVKTGLLGLGARLYIPLSALHDTLRDCVFVAGTKEEFARLGWAEKPAHLDQVY